MAYSNKHLIEVTCGFQFNNETSKWDSVYFGQYYDKIKDQGFTERQEKKGIQIQVNANPADSSTSIKTTSQNLEDQVIFKNPSNGWAVKIGKGKISFHIVNNYTIWEDFLNLFIKPYVEKYLDLGLGNGPRQCNVIYLNRFLKPATENLSDYFTVVSPMNLDFGIETTTFVQRVFNDKGKNLLITKLNSKTIDKTNTINLECGAVCINNDSINSVDWVDQANSTHAPIKAFFEAIITEKLRKEL